MHTAVVCLSALSSCYEIRVERQWNLLLGYKTEVAQGKMVMWPACRRGSAGVTIAAKLNSGLFQSWVRGMQTTQRLETLRRTLSLFVKPLGAQSTAVMRPGHAAVQQQEFLIPQIPACRVCMSLWSLHTVGPKLVGSNVSKWAVCECRAW